MAVAVGVSDMWQVTCDTWHVTCDMWYVTHDMWHLTPDIWHLHLICIHFLVLLSAHFERFSVSRIQDFFYICVSPFYDGPPHTPRLKLHNSFVISCPPDTDTIEQGYFSFVGWTENWIGLWSGTDRDFPRNLHCNDSDCFNRLAHNRDPLFWWSAGLPVHTLGQPFFGCTDTSHLWSTTSNDHNF